jgi:hypothetical protein
MLLPEHSHWLFGAKQQNIQERTFTRWVNEHIKRRGLHIESLAKGPTKLSCLLCALALLTVMHQISRMESRCATCWK